MPYTVPLETQIRRTVHFLNGASFAFDLAPYMGRAVAIQLFTTYADVLDRLIAKRELEAERAEKIKAHHEMARVNPGA